MSTEKIDELKTLLALQDREGVEMQLDLSYLADLLMRVTGCGPGDSIQTAIDRATDNNAVVNITLNR